MRGAREIPVARQQNILSRRSGERFQKQQQGIFRDRGVEHGKSLMGSGVRRDTQRGCGLAARFFFPGAQMNPELGRLFCEER